MSLTYFRGCQIILASSYADDICINLVPKHLSWPKKCFWNGSQLPVLCRYVQNYTLKIRYGLQLMGKVRTDEHESSQSDLKALQKTQNKMIRLLSGTNISPFPSPSHHCSALKLECFISKG